MPFVDVNNYKKRPRLEDLVVLMEAFTNDNCSDQNVKDESIFVDNGPGSPVVPVQSTPATGSSTYDPPPSPPEGLASPIGGPPSAPSSAQADATTSNSDSHFAPTPVVPAARVRPPLSFGEVTKIKFGSESVYCGDTWQSVLQACSKLTQIQSSKMLRILGILNEDVRI